MTKNPTDERSRVPFEGCDAASVFSEMTSQVHSAEGRTLWTRMLQEVHRKGVDASISYLESEFARVKEDLSRELDRLESED